MAPARARMTPETLRYFTCLVLVLVFLQLSEFVQVDADTSVQDRIEHISEENPLRHASLRTSRISGGDYNLMRVSKVWRGKPWKARNSSSTLKSFQFKHRWTHLSFATEVVKVSADFPKPGDPVRGLLLADVCISSNFVPCTFGKSYQTLARITWALNTLANEGLNFWVMGGDNLYDEDGSISERFFGRLSPKALTVPLISVPGNHDFWTRGTPSVYVNNQFGYGFAQFYMMDTDAAKANVDYPFNFPEKNEEEISEIPTSENFFHYSAIGLAGFIGFSGAHTLEVDRFERACNYFLEGQPGEKSSFIFLVGHWSTENMGCQPGMHTEGLFNIMSERDGPFQKSCYRLVSAKRLYYVDGHFHDNKKLSEFGMRVAGQGMIDTGAFGFPLVEIFEDSTRKKHLVISYVALAKGFDDLLVDLRFSQLQACANIHGIFGCLNRLPFVDVWVNTTIVT